MKRLNYIAIKEGYMQNIYIGMDSGNRHQVSLSVLPRALQSEYAKSRDILPDSFKIGYDTIYADMITLEGVRIWLKDKASKGRRTMYEDELLLEAIRRLNYIDSIIGNLKVNTHQSPDQINQAICNFIYHRPAPKNEVISSQEYEALKKKILEFSHRFHAADIDYFVSGRVNPDNSILKSEKQIVLDIHKCIRNHFKIHSSRHLLLKDYNMVMEWLGRMDCRIRPYGEGALDDACRQL